MGRETGSKSIDEGSSRTRVVGTGTMIAVRWTTTPWGQKKTAWKKVVVFVRILYCCF